MSKKLSIITLGISLSSIVILTGAMIVSQPKYKLKNIVGKQSSLGDVVVFSQDNRGIYSRNNLILSKDNYEFNKNVKQNPEIYKYSKILNENRDLFTYGIYDINRIYSDENSVGYLEYINDLHTESNVKLLTTINEKNINTGKTIEFEIEIPNSLKPQNNINYNPLVTKYEDNVYIALIGEQENIPDIKKGEKEELEDYIQISKVDFNTKEVKSVNKINMKIDKDTKYRVVNYNSFTVDNRIYFFMKNKEQSKNIYYLAYYDIENNKFDYINNKINLNLPLDQYLLDIEGEMLNLLTYSVEKDKVNLNLTSINLDSEKLIFNNEKYSINKLNKEINISDFRVIDNKIYMLASAWMDYKSNIPDSRNNYTENIIVVDKTSKSTLYIGEYRQGTEFTANSYIIKNEDL